jgi:hypothetical protein
VPCPRLCLCRVQATPFTVTAAIGPLAGFSLHHHGLSHTQPEKKIEKEKRETGSAKKKRKMRKEANRK